MRSLDSIAPAFYTRINRGVVSDSEELFQRLLAGRIPAFVITSAGVNLAQAARETGLLTALKENGYMGNTRDTVSFGAEIKTILPQDLSNTPIPQGVEWHWAGVTTLHSDMPDSGRGQCYSLNFTSTGKSEFRMHQSRIPDDKFNDQFDIFDVQVGQLLWHGIVDTEIVSPEGYIMEVEEGDLLVFDPSYAHMSRALTSPRKAEAAFFERRDRTS